MTVTASLVKELRERTGAGMMECKKALVASNGDIDSAIEAMRKSGQAKAVKKGSRVAAEGLVELLASDDNKKAVLVELNCETDFVAKEEKFQAFGRLIAEQALQNHITDVKELMALSAGGQTLDERRIELVATLGENISLRRVHIQEAKEGVLGAYGHKSATGIRIGVLLHLSSNDIDLAKDIAMHVAAMNPEFLAEADVDAARIAKEKEIYMEQAREQHQGKPDDIIEKIIGGKVKKMISEITLLGQAYVKDNGKTVEALLKEEGANILSYTRFEVGEGIEKKEDNFVEDVMSQVKG